VRAAVWRLFRPISATRRLGARGEREAAKYLTGLGYRVLGRNVRVPMGEADLVCESPEGAVVVVEVKTRTRGVSARSDSIPPEAAITPEKRRRLRRIAAHLAKANGWAGRAVRVDAIAVEVPARGEPVIRHTRGVG
jgi:putative endonuclease